LDLKMDWSGGVDYGMDCGMGINFENKFSIAINDYAWFMTC